MDSTFQIIDSVRCTPGISTDSHGMYIMSNGNYLLMGKEDTIMDLSAYHYFSNNGSPGSAAATVKTGLLQELDQNKNLVFEWHAKDHFSFDDVDSTFLSDPNTVDWTHFNSVSEDNDGNILLSVRHFDEVTKIERGTGRVLWRLGGKRSSFSFTNDPQKFRGQHSAHRTASGTILLLDNGSLNPLHPVQAKEYSLDETVMTATLSWYHLENPAVFSNSTGNAQRLTNGNTLVNYGNTSSNQNIMFNVVDPAGNKTFEIVFEDTMSTYRAFNYDSLPWGLNRPQLTCVDSGGQFYLDAGSGYASYLWSSGATTQTIPVSAADTFSVFVPYGIGFIRSEEFIVTDPLNPCLQTVVTEDPGPSLISLNTNPFTSQLMIDVKTMKDGLCSLVVMDASGRKVVEKNSHLTSGFNTLVMPSSDWPAGMYFVRCTIGAKTIVLKAIRSDN